MSNLRETNKNISLAAKKYLIQRWMPRPSKYELIAFNVSA